MPNKSAPEWISVKERLPEKNKTVLCYCESRCGGGTAYSIGAVDNGFWFLQSTVGIVSFPNLEWDVTYWMEIPKNNKKEE